MNRRQALKMNSVALVAAYFRYFSFRAGKFLGAEVWVGAAPVDLVWNTDGVIWIDEIKTGSSAIRETREGLELQVKEHWSAGASEFGSKFGGVRAILLDHVESSFHVDADGARHPGVPR